MLNETEIKALKNKALSAVEKIILTNIDNQKKKSDYAVQEYMEKYNLEPFVRKNRFSVDTRTIGIKQYSDESINAMKGLVSGLLSLH